jgi:hypothetical protein
MAGFNDELLRNFHDAVRASARHPPLRRLCGTTPGAHAAACAGAPPRARPPSGAQAAARCDAQGVFEFAKELGIIPETSLIGAPVSCLLACAPR